MTKRTRNGKGTQEGNEPSGTLAAALTPLMSGMAATRMHLLDGVQGLGVRALELVCAAEAEALAGPKGKHQAERTHHHWGRTPAELTFGGRRIQVQRPRVRSCEGEEAVLPAVAAWRERDPLTALLQAGTETWDLSVGTLKAMWQIVIGTRAVDELGGPLRIAQMSGEVAQGGMVAVLWFMAVLSINLGLINLFPVPVLDGGHLLFYAAEAVRGKPLGQRAQEYGFRIGLALVLTLMVFATWNDLVHLRIVEFVRGLVT